MELANCFAFHQRTVAALRAAAARAGEPLPPRPPSFPSATACLFFFNFFLAMLYCIALSMRHVNDFHSGKDDQRGPGRLPGTLDARQGPER